MENGSPFVPDSTESTPEDAPHTLESLCMHCRENGTTTILPTSIPHFKDVIIMAFECPHCGLRNNEMQSLMTELKGIGLKLTVPSESPDVLSRQIVRSDKATVKIPELDFEIPGIGQRGSITTIEGLLK